MENKYFTPDIEDICIGYEYEQLVTPLSESLSKSEPEWMKCKFPDPFTIDRILLLYERKEQLRVPYLTKEQIEAEGWELIQIYPKGACIFQKGTKEEGCELTCDFTEHRVHFTKLYFYGLDDKYTRTKLTWRSLECKDINTFRKIIKLLGI
jgi:hypothetical protein